MMRNKTGFLLVTGVLAIGFLLVASGLVSLDGGPADAQATQEDRLIGVLVTLDYLDEMNLDLTPGQAAGPDGMYRNRLTATLIQEEHPSEDGGTVMMPAYAFEGVDGLELYAPAVEIQGEARHTSRVSPGYGDVKLGYHDKDGGTDLSLEGTLWLAKGGPEFLVLNPVYQTASGEVYALAGDSVGFSGMDGSDIDSSFAIKQSHTWQSKGSVMLQENPASQEETTGMYTTTVEVHFRSLQLPEAYAIVQFDADNTVLSREAYAPGEIPETIETLPGAAWLMLEGKPGSLGTANASRVLYEKGDSLLTSYVPRADGLCAPVLSGINWGESY
jgi:hypothetical protein